MKRRWILRGIVAVGLIVVVLVVAVAFSLGTIVKKTVEKIGPEATQVDVRLANAEVWVVTERVHLTGFFMGNPPGYKKPSALEVGDVTVKVKPGSVFSDKLVVETIEIKKPIITLEGGLKNNNLTQIQKNLNDYVATSPQPSGGNATPSPAPVAATNAPAAPERKLQVNDLVISGAKLQFDLKMTGGKEIVVPIPDIHLTDLGTGPDGITPAQLGQRVLSAILSAAGDAAIKNADTLGKEALKDVQGAAKKIDVKKLTDKVKGLFQ